MEFKKLIPSILKLLAQGKKLHDVVFFNQSQIFFTVDLSEIVS